MVKKVHYGLCENGELGKQQLCTCVTLFCTFLCRHYTTTIDVKLA